MKDDDDELEWRLALKPGDSVLLGPFHGGRRFGRIDPPWITAEVERVTPKRVSVRYRNGTYTFATASNYPHGHEYKTAPGVYKPTPERLCAHAQALLHEALAHAYFGVEESVRESALEQGQLLDLARLITEIRAIIPHKSKVDPERLDRSVERLRAAMKKKREAEDTEPINMCALCSGVTEPTIGAIAACVQCGSVYIKSISDKASDRVR